MAGESDERKPVLPNISTASLAGGAGGEMDIRSASEAMQRAAEAMMAATETFRRQFTGQEDAQELRRPLTHHPYAPIDDMQQQQQQQQQRLPQRKSTGAPVWPMTPYHDAYAPPLPISAASSMHNLSRPLTNQTSPQYPYTTTPYITPVPAAASLPDFLSNRPTMPPLAHGRETNAFGARVMRGTAISTYDDGYQGAYKLKSETQSLMGGKHGSSIDEPSPVVQIGRYTYVRSDTDDFRTALINSEYAAGMDDVVGQPPDSPRKPPQGLAGGADDRPYGFTLTREIAFVWMVCVSQLLMLAAIGQAMVPAYIIGRSFPNTTFGDMAWYSAAYGLTAGTFVLPAGRLGDLFGHKTMFIIGFVWFGLWSLACGFADMVQLAGGQGTVFFCVSRAIQGIGPALLVPNGQAMLGRGYKPGPRKNMVMCLFGAAAPLGFVLGAVMGSLFAQYATWPWAFWTLAAVCIALAAISGLVMPNTGVTRRNKEESLWSQLDVGGMVLGVSGLVLFNFAFNQAPIVSWGTPYTYFILVIGVILIGAFIFVETVVPHPLVPVNAMRAQTVYVLACTGTGWGCFSVWVFYAIMFLQNLRGWGALLTSAAFAPAPVTGLAASLLTGYLMARIGPPWIMFISMCAFFIGSLLLATAPVDQSYWFNTFFGILVMPFGMDMSNPAAVIMLSNSVSKEHQGIAASLVVTVVNYAISIALGFAGTVEVNLHNHGNDLFAGYRGAQYFGLGLGGLGVLLGAAFLFQTSKAPKGPPPGTSTSGGDVPQKV
ncbi:hypothetical protein MAPG_03589 [Magnaporthiopsis poae ATCC 64411]|uniref:Major facilitator superfamily (MFS) profile domain-containing protein n=1 Tax=Magnaporthiopsis poae (strain ATCC 64411 / 73-15) TaxID=644358 RepID=A0A0C4DUE9_MAGP6|nr:hypothetical protein MAPG_03589 [Magnaporthiopsis poae ATCC 64411]